MSKQAEVGIATTISVLKRKTAGYFEKEIELQNTDVGQKDRIHFDLF